MRGEQIHRLNPRCLRFGKYLIRSARPFTDLEMLVLTQRNSQAIILTRDRMYDGLWDIVESLR